MGGAWLGWLVVAGWWVAGWCLLAFRKANHSWPKVGLDCTDEAAQHTCTGSYDTLSQLELLHHSASGGGGGDLQWNGCATFVNPCGWVLGVQGWTYTEPQFDS